MEETLCPWCGRWFEKLERSGFCQKCTVIAKHGRVSSSPCEQCGRWHATDRLICSSCRSKRADAAKRRTSHKTKKVA